MNPSPHNYRGRTPLSGVAFAAAFTLALIAQTSVARISDADLARQAADPTQSPLSLQVYDHTTPDHDGGGSNNQLVFRPVIPYEAFGVDNIVRFTFTHNTDWPTGPNQFTDDKWTLGPAVADVTSTSGDTTFGALAQSFFSFAGNGRDVRQLAIQPVLAIPQGGAKTLSLGNAGVLHDIESSRRVSAAPSAQFSWMTDLLGMKLRPSFEVTHELSDLPGNPRTTFRIGTQILSPC